MEPRSESGIPSPINIAPSREWNGNDGNWSTFVLRVGTPEQNFKVLPASDISEVLLPVAEGCTSSDSPDCGALRGAYQFNGQPSNGFNRKISSTWRELGFFSTDWVKKDWKYSGNALYGLERVGLGIQNSGGPTLPDQIVGGIKTKDLYLGLFGLSLGLQNFTNSDHPQRSLLATLNETGWIPSMSYGYTAGAYYHSPQVFGSLTLGGFDQSRLFPSNINFPFDRDNSRPLSLNVYSITATDTENGTSLLDEQTYFELDFTVPHLWLPRKTCDLFESAFRLSYDSDTDLYTVNESTHDYLLTTNPTITIGLGASADPVKRVNVVLPYSAMDLVASHPIYQSDKSVRYFPIRRASEHFTLGRVLLQEAYLVVDYERQNFSLHKAFIPQPGQMEDIVPISRPSYLSSTGEPKHRDSSAGHLKSGVIAGITIALIILAGLGVTLALVLRRRKKANQTIQKNMETPEIPSIDHEESSRPMIMGQEVHEMFHSTARETDGTPQAEIDGTPQVEIDGNPRAELEGDRNGAVNE
jgi:hypothetical protein